ncbi:MAG: hypothetical protein H0V66_06710, partial [Bdellovibrionales bacterium]|nr:hypothetical protein [Bdellovibrionales bacterium]
ELVAKSQVLNALKAKQLQARPDLITFRNFALEKLHSAECMTPGESNINTCYADLGNISREAITLAGEANDILYIFDKPKEATAVDQLCTGSKEEVDFKKELCALKDEDPSKKSSRKKIDSYEAPVSPDDNNSMGKALLGLGQSILNTAAGYMAPRMSNQPPVDPYARPPYPYVLPRPQPVQPYPFGTYFPTPGLPPYSSIKSNVGIASAYTPSGGTHFNYPVGW